MTTKPPSETRFLSEQLKPQTATTPSETRFLSQQLKLQTSANRYAKLQQDIAAKVISRIVNS
jgi:hypothetical protein